MSTPYTLKNLEDLEDKSPGFGLGEHGQARFGREALGAERTGMTYYRWNPGRRVTFGHKHKACEEMYVVIGGGGRMKLDDDVVELRPRDALRVAPGTMREWEAGPDGLEMLAFGEHAPDDGEMTPGWWTD